MTRNRSRAGLRDVRIVTTTRRIRCLGLIFFSLSIGYVNRARVESATVDRNRVRWFY